MIGGALASMARRIYGIVEVEFLLRDEFTTPDAAPITSPRTCEPGPGTLTTLHPTQFDIAGGKLFHISASAGVISSAIQARTSGLVGIAIPTSTSASGISSVGFITGVDYGLRILTNTLSYYLGIDPWVITIYTGSPLNNSIITVIRTVGAFLIMDDTLLWVDMRDSSDRAFALYSNYGIEFDSLRLAQLATPWDTDNGIATDEIASPVVTDTFTHEADCLIEYNIDVLPPAGWHHLIFRQQDANNCWILAIGDTGYIRLYEKVSASSTLRGEVLGALSGGERIVIICDDETITAYYDNTQAFSYSSAVNFKTNTSGEVRVDSSGTVSNLITWPRVLSGDALTELEKYTQ